MKRVVISMLAAAVILLAACGDDEKDNTVAVTDVALSESTLSIVAGDNTKTLTATVAPSDATNSDVTWSVSPATGVITLSATTGATVTITTVAPGSATITVTTAEGAKTATCAVTVTAAPVAVESVELDITQHTFTALGATITLVPTVLPANATNKNVQWSTSNPQVATVENGVVTSVGNGTANITVTTVDGNKTDVCAVTVDYVMPSMGEITGIPGINRAAIEVEINNEQIKAVKATLVSSGVSQQTEVNYQEGTFTIHFAELAEGKHSFNVVSIDANDLESEPETIEIEVFGDAYKNSILSAPAPFTSELIVEPGDDGTPKAGAPAALLLSFDEGVEGNVSYTSIAGNPANASVTGNQLILPDVDPTKAISYTASFLPHPKSMDTFERTFDAFPKIGKNGANIIRMVNHDFGGVNVAFFSARANTTEAQYAYRTNMGDTNTGVHLPLYEGPPVMNLGGIAVGNWFNYTVYVEDAGTYLFNCEVAVHLTANPSAATSVNKVEINDVAYDFTLGRTGGWTTFRWHWAHWHTASEVAEFAPTPEEAFEVALTQGWNTIRWTVGNPANCNLRRLHFQWKD